MSRPKLQPVSGDFVVFRYRNRHTVCLVGGGARNPVALHAIVTYCVQTTFQAFALASAQVLVPGANFCHHCGWKKGAVKATVVRTEAPFAKSLRHDYCWSRAAESWLTVSTCGPSLSMLQCTTSCRECAPHAGLKAIAEHAACSLTEFGHLRPFRTNSRGWPKVSVAAGGRSCAAAWRGAGSKVAGSKHQMRRLPSQAALVIRRPRLLAFCYEHAA